MRVYWYAPFDNAGETDLAAAFGASTTHELTVEACSHRFGTPLPGAAGRYALVRDLPPPAGEMGERRWAGRQLGVLLQRTMRRRRLVGRERFDVIHLHTFNLVTDWLAIRRLRGRAGMVVQSVHDVRPQKSRLPRSVETALLGAGYRACDRLVVAHPYLAELLVTEFGIPSERIRVVALPVAAEANNLPPAPRVAGQPLRVLFFGTFRQNKGMLVLLAAIERLAEWGDLQLTIAGRGDADLEAAVRAAAARDRRIVAEVGYVTSERRTELLDAADVLVLPYTAFNSQSGVLTRDAYAAMRPVIATTVGALGRAVTTDGSGWLVPPGDVEALCAMLQHVAAAPDDYNATVELMRSLVVARAPEEIAGRFEAIYCEGPFPRGRRPSASA